MTMKLKKFDKKFLEVKKANLSLSWREVFKGNLMADAMVDGVTFTFDERIPAALKKSIPPVDKSGRDMPRLFPWPV